MGYVDLLLRWFTSGLIMTLMTTTNSSPAEEIDLFALLGTPEELEAEMAEAARVALGAAEAELIAAFEIAVSRITNARLWTADMDRRSAKARLHGERSRRYSRYD
jgi:hypothetical protein